MPPQRQLTTKNRKHSASDKAGIELQKASLGRKRKLEAVISKASSQPAKPQNRQKEALPVQNNVPTQLLDVFAFGTNCYGELGLGDSTKKAEMTRPLLNPKLAADTVGVVHVAVGGVHSAALTWDNKILTWGVNDEGALGRDTKEEKKPLDQDSTDDVNDEAESDSDDDDEVTLNLKEATPLPVDPCHFPRGTVFTQLAATDSATFALTRDGLVYSWGTFRGGSGTIGFSPNNSKEQPTPVLITELNNVTKLVAGAQHVLALTSTGAVFSWGCNEQHQLGRRRTPRRLDHSHPLVPDKCALPPSTIDIGAGMYHSFAIQKNGAVYGWGSNNFGQTGISMSGGQSDAIIEYPTQARSFQQYGRVTSILGGKDHSMAVTEEGHCLVWGRIDNKALGISPQDMPSSIIIFDDYNRPRILKVPTPISGISDQIVFATAGTDHSFAVTKAGQAYSWGFNSQHQAGQIGDDEIEKPTLLQSKYVDGKKLVSAAAGGQFSIVVGEYASSGQKQ